ncbi:transposase [Embleya sp. NPDC020886]|uniref:transposase n=1 Tax=Embleya sp. NPDC020886 TaxID=3363980 RepID=UPI0037AECBD0
MGAEDLTEEQWTVLEPVLPKGAKTGWPPVWSRRRPIDGIRFRIRTAVPWRDVPVEHEPWGRVYDLFRRWQRNGTWHRILTRLQSMADAEGAIVWDLSIDSTVCRAHQHAAGARKQGDLQKEPPTAAPTASKDTVLSPRDTTSSPSATRRLSLSLPQTSGCDQHRKHSWCSGP